MGWLIAALGTGLAIGGTAAIYFGAPYIQVEWGYAEVIAGTTALSAGILAVALAAILFALRDLKRLATRDGRGGWTAERPGPMSVTSSDGFAAAPPVVAASPADPAPSFAPSFAPSPVPRPVDAPSYPPAHGGASSNGEAPTVVGRYEANGAHYVLFSDGTIEVETETGTHRYASMQDLRSHIEAEQPH